MLVGINYPWIDYGWDFGFPPSAWVAEDKVCEWREGKRKRIDEDFRRFSLQGISAVRWFLLGDGSNFGMDEFAPQKIGGKWIFDPLPEGHPYYSQLSDDFRYLLQICRRHGLKLLPSLIDFGWCFQGASAAGIPGIVKGGRYDIIRNPAKRQAFFDRAFEPLLDASLQYPDTLYAWELINEPEWAVRTFWNLFGKCKNRTVPLDEMKEFIAEGVDRINKKKSPDGSGAFQSSVGFAHWETMDTWDAEKLGITLHQFHYYAQKNRRLPEHSELTSHPCVVGEFATAAERDWPDLSLRNKDQTTANRLCCIENKEYPACFLWSANAVDRATRWTDVEHREVYAFTGASPADNRRA